MEVLYYILLNSYGNNTCWNIVNNGNISCKIMALKLIEWSKIEMEYAKRLDILKNGIGDENVYILLLLVLIKLTVQL